MRVYMARYVLPVATHAIQDGAVAVRDGRITAVGPGNELLESAGEDAMVRDLGDAVVIPGLANAHTHLELSWLSDAAAATRDYESWLRELLHRRADEDRGVARAAAERAVRDLVSRGTVAVGDVANSTWIASVIAQSPLHGVLFHEIYGFRAADAEELLRDAAARLEALASDPDLGAVTDRLRVVLTPHAPYTTSAPLLRALAGRAQAAAEPLSVHVAESEAESALLQDASGPFPGLFRERGVWDEGWKPPGRTPVEYLDRLGLLTPRTLAVHCVRLGRPDVSLLQARGVTVVTCPRSNRQLGVGTAPVPQILGAGIPVALGTDSLASAPDLDLFAEMAALREDHPSLAPATILRMATVNGARALGVDGRLGTIEAGKLAELVVIPLESADDDPFEVLCSCPAQVYALAEAPHEAVES